ncbi:MAG TPA: inorganic diphosphatase [Acidimicrobiales bacterium]
MAEDRVEDEVEVIVEIPRGSRNKYEFDHDRHVIRLDRRLSSATVYPADYGFIPDTLAQDGDPLDALVLVEDPTFPGVHITARPVAVFWMSDEKGPDAKVICVPSHEPRWKDVSDLAQLPIGLVEEIRHFFDVYKDLEPGKQTSIKGYEGRDAAWREVAASRERQTEAARALPEAGR